MTADELYRQGKLDEAIEAALRRVKSAPTDVEARLMLCDLLCLDQQLERADRQLEVLFQQDSGLAPAIGLYRQLIRAAVARADLFTSGRPPEFTADVSDVLKLHLRASIAIRDGNAAEAAALLQEAEVLRTPIAGDCDGEPFEDLRDLDDLMAPFLEVLTSTGKYYWVAWERIETLEFRPPKYLRDLLWRQAEMKIRQGPDAVVYVPVLYPASDRNGDPALRLGRRTEWSGPSAGPIAGVGQRTLLVGDRDRPILSIGRIAFSNQPAATPPTPVAE